MDPLSLSTMSLPPVGTDPTSLAGLARSRDPQAIEAVAQGFESLFVSMLVKQMRQTLDESASLFGDDKGDILGGMFDFTMGQHLAQAGALGIGNILRQQLTRGHET